MFWGGTYQYVYTHPRVKLGVLEVLFWRQISHLGPLWLSYQIRRANYHRDTSRPLKGGLSSGLAFDGCAAVLGNVEEHSAHFETICRCCFYDDLLILGIAMPEGN